MSATRFDPDNVTWEQIWEWLLQADHEDELIEYEETTFSAASPRSMHNIKVVAWDYPAEALPKFIDAL